MAAAKDTAKAGRGRGRNAAARPSRADAGKPAKKPLRKPARKSPRKPDGTKIESRDRLLAAACALMTERGTIDVPLSEIGRRAGLNAALVKYYYGGKQGLLMALLKDVLGRGLEQMAGLVLMDLNPVDKLKLHIKGIMGIYFRFPFVNRLIHYMFEDPVLGREVGETISRPLAATQRKLLEQAIAAGFIRPVDPMLFYFIVLGACDQLFFGKHILREAFGILGVDEALHRNYTDALLDTLLDGILVERSRRNTAALALIRATNAG